MVVTEGERPRRPWRLAIVGVLLAPLLTACLGSDFTYVKSSSNRTYYKVPTQWKLFSQDDVLSGSKSKLSQEELDALRGTTWQTAFDGDPQPSLKHTTNLARSYPVGIALVQTLSDDDRDSMSLASLRNFAVDIDTALDQGSAQVVSYNTITRDGGFHGIDMVVRLSLQSGGSVTLSQVSLLDANTSKVYVLVVSCTSVCYQQQKSKIESVLKSWTVRKSQ